MTDTEKKIIERNIGRKVQYDSFAGILSGVIAGLTPLEGGVVLRITSRKNKTYKSGELITVSFNRIIPNKREVITRQGKYYILPANWNSPCVDCIVNNDDCDNCKLG